MYKPLICISLACLIVLSCKKERDPVLVVTVKDEAGALISGAMVVVYPDTSLMTDNDIVNSEMIDSALTVDDGTAEFEFRQTAILNISARKKNGSTTKYGKEIVRIEKRRQASKENFFEEELVIY